MPITDVAGVLVHTSKSRFHAMRAFYVEVLGLTPRSDRAGFVNFEFGYQRLTIAVHDAVAGESDHPERIMINLAVRDIDTLWHRIVVSGSVAVRSPSLEPWGGLVATFEDPDGNFIQLMQFTPGAGAL